MRAWKPSAQTGPRPRQREAVHAPTAHRSPRPAMAVPRLDYSFARIAVGPPPVAAHRAPVQRAPTSAPVIQRYGPGDPVPTKAEHLAERLKLMTAEAGITGDAVTRKALQKIRAGVQARYQIEGSHPLAIYEMQDLDDLAREAIFWQSHENNEHVGDVETFAGVTLAQALGPKITMSDLLRQQILSNPEPLKQKIEELAAPFWREALADPDVNPDARLRDLFSGEAPGTDPYRKAAEAYLATANRPQIEELDDGQRQRMIDALESLPIVEMAYRGELGTGSGTGLLMKGMDITPGAGQQLRSGRGMDLTDRIAKGLNRFADLVEPERRPPEERTTFFEINPDIEKKRLAGLLPSEFERYRASATRDSRVHLSVTGTPETTVHELGHQVEFNLPVEDWLDLQDLLEMRNQGGPLVPIYPGATDPEVAREAAVNAVMPATGLYSAKVYHGGDTEVMSMSMEYLSHPVTARKLIREDPLQAAIILRLIRPTEFNALMPDELRGLLPRGDIAPPPLLSPSVLPMGFDPSLDDPWANVEGVAPEEWDE